ncbi:hypothetical protein GUI12_04230 [Anaplasmataceae bacterium AB001_6]|nr:hypothetical protein GUI12_04230 [Anaplasmataceae bacterium AB001_6]
MFYDDDIIMFETKNEAEAISIVPNNNSIEDVLYSINTQEKCNLLEEMPPENNDPKDEDINSDSAKDIHQSSDDLHAKFDLLKKMCITNKSKISKIKKKLSNIKKQIEIDDNTVDSLHKIKMSENFKPRDFAVTLLNSTLSEIISSSINEKICYVTRKIQFRNMFICNLFESMNGLDEYL